MDVHITTKLPPGRLARPGGFTLVELALTLVVAAIMLAIAVPNFRQFLLNQNTRTAVSDAYASIASARSEAIRRNSTVDVVAIDNDWAKGWEVQASGTVIMRQPGFSRLSVSGPSHPTLTFRQDGRLAGSGSTSFDFSTGNDTAFSKRCIKISVSGRPTLQVDGNGNGNCSDG